MRKAMKRICLWKASIRAAILRRQAEESIDRSFARHPIGGGLRMTAGRGARLCERGFTMVETMFVALLFPLLFLSMYSVLDMSRVILQTNTVFSQLNQNAMKSLRSISREVGQSSPLSAPSHLALAQDANLNTVIRFQIPVDWDNDGDAHSGTLNPQAEWGAYDWAGETQNGRLGGWARYSVVANPATQTNRLIREILDATLTPVAGLSQVVIDNVQSFTVTQNQETLRMILVLRGTEQIGQSGGTRTLQTTFTSDTTLRNAVS